MRWTGAALGVTFTGLAPQRPESLFAEADIDSLIAVLPAVRTAAAPGVAVA